MPTGETFETAYTRTKTAGKWLDGEAGKVPATSDPERVLITRVMISILFYVPSRLLFATSTGYMGLGPKATQVGDMAYLLVSGEVPNERSTRHKALRPSSELICDIMAR